MVLIALIVPPFLPCSRGQMENVVLFALGLSVSAAEPGEVDPQQVAILSCKERATLRNDMDLAAVEPRSAIRD